MCANTGLHLPESPVSPCLLSSVVVLVIRTLNVKSTLLANVDVCFKNEKD